jgi:hypothetical protein
MSRIPHEDEPTLLELYLEQQRRKEEIAEREGLYEDE